ncbi:MAG TPA: c-type cytochrome [Candidatus Acidoferrales bacterium]|nr:c-type cytochrome [Candidatus Acidoferrales bacterium]
MSLKRKHMKALRRFVFVALLAATAAVSFVYPQQVRKTSSMSQKQNAQASQSQANPSQVDRGRYLVEEVAKCTECHTPRDEDGNLDRSRWLQGATIWIKPVHGVQNWAEWAPRLAGLPQFSDEQVEQILERGKGPNGAPIRPPMHIYHMTHADADSIIAYLRSLADKTTSRGTAAPARKAAPPSSQR